MSRIFRLAGHGSACAAMLALSTAVAQNTNPVSKWYVNVGLGPVLQEDITVKEGSLFISVPGDKIQFNTGGGIDVGVGYHLTRSLAVEFETGFSFNETRSVGGDSSDSATFDLFQVPVLANLSCEIPTGSRIKPFLGAGVGGVYTSVEHLDFFSPSGDEAFVFGYQAFAGIRYEIDRHWAVSLQYRFRGTSDFSFDGNLQAKITGTRTHSLAAGFSFTF